MRLFRKSCSALAMVALLSFAIRVEGANPHGARITAPVMTPLTVKLDQAVGAKTAANGTGFTALVKDPVQVDGVVVIPANSSAGGLVNKEPRGSSELQLNSVFVNGRLYRITTEPIPFGQKANFRAGSTFTFHLVLALSISR